MLSVNVEYRKMLQTCTGNHFQKNIYVKLLNKFSDLNSERYAYQFKNH